MYGVYLLKSKKDGKIYIGYSLDVKRRFEEHQEGKVSSTKDNRPHEVIYCELYKNRKDAINREMFFKTGWGRRYIKKVLRNSLLE